MDNTQTLTLYDIEPPIYIIQSNWLLFLMIILLLGVVIFTLYMRRKKKMLTPQFFNPYEEALTQLSRLNVADLSSDNLFAFELSQIMKTFLQKKFKISLDNKTTEELLMSPFVLKKINLKAIQELKDFFIHCDLVKFAQKPFTQEERYAYVQRAQNILSSFNSTIS